MTPSTNLKTNKYDTGMYNRYFVYSAEEEDLRLNIHGNNASFGNVIVKGVPKRYTSILTNMDDAKSDAILLIKGDIRKIRYTAPGKE